MKVNTSCSPFVRGSAGFLDLLFQSVFVTQGIAFPTAFGIPPRNDDSAVRFTGCGLSYYYRSGWLSASRPMAQSVSPVNEQCPTPDNQQLSTDTHHGLS